MAEGTGFKLVIADPYFANASESARAAVKRHLLCSGKVYYDVVDAIEKAGLRDVVAVTRVEQIAPFPYHEVRDADKNFPNAEVAWVQEEHMNMGPWTYVQPRIETAVKGHRGDIRVRYFGRGPSAVAATGSHKISHDELHAFLHACTTL